MPNAATTVPEYLASLPDDRRGPVSALRDAINARLPAGYAEGIQYGMLGWFVPHSVYPAGYHCDPKQPVPFVGVASQKAHIAAYLFCLYVDPELHAWFLEEYAKTGKKADMGKGCVRFKKPADIPYALIGETVARMPVDTFLARYVPQIPARKK